MLNSTNEFQFRDNALKVHSSGDGQLDIDADTEVEITTTTLDMNGNVDISGTIVNGSSITSTGAVLPASSDGAALGSASAEWSDIFVADAGVINLGDDQEVTLTHVHNTGMLLSDNDQFQFRDSDLKVFSSTNGQLDIDADNEVEITTPNLDIDASSGVNISNELTVGAAINSTGAVLPATANGAALGSASKEWSDAFFADEAVIKMGADQDVTLTHAADAGVILNSTMKLYFEDTSNKDQYIGSTGSGVTAIAAPTEVDITATTIDMNGNVDISGTIVNGSSITSTGAVLPASSDGAALGSASAEWSDVYVADAGVLNLGDDQEVTLTHVHNSGVLLNSTNEFQFRDNALKVHSSTDGQLDIDADTEVEITSTTIDMNGEVAISCLLYTSPSPRD